MSLRAKVSVLFVFAVTLDYKALLLLLNKKDDKDFILGGKGYDVECCAYCNAIRVNIVLIQCAYNKIIIIKLLFIVLNILTILYFPE